MGTTGNETPRTRERHRTYWTPAMERHFVDMMLDHMQKGNRSGHTFSKQAWNDMLADFNTKFGSQYDKDVLKGRYTSLWKQFNDVKNMLGHGGFSWDTTRNMVVADDYVWDTYVKAHPDTRSYKTKAVQNFSDLCLIYGYTTADGRYSRSSHDLDVDDEVHAMSLGDVLGSPTPSTAVRSNTDWTLAMDQYFAELLFEQREKGNKLDNSYTKEAWGEMLNLFNAKFGCRQNKKGLRHRYKKLLKYYTDIMVLLKQDGFSWDEKEQMVVADDDVWEAYIEVHPQARAYRTISMPSYKDLELIFGSDIIDESSNLVDKSADDEFMGLRLGAPRTHWTPPMDRYLVDLLVVQVNKGNRNGKSFVAQAWLDMIRSFNSNFGIRRDKDVLKNRYKQLKKQYDDIKTILGEKGFYWDDSHEMVVAKDHVWDSYLRAHPEARSYRDKTVPNYHKLCTIYDLDSTKRQYISLARKVAPDGAAFSDIDECSGSLLLLEAKNKWTPEMNDCFIELMLEHHKGYNKIDHGFDDEIWSVIVPLFNKRSNLQYEKRDLQDRLSYFMEQFNEVESLITQDGFSWDATCQMVKASDESWEACSKEHPFATTYKGTVLRHHKDLSKIFGGSYSEKLKAYVDTPKDRKTSNKRKRLRNSPLTTGRGGKVPKKHSDEMKEAFTDMANVVSKLVNNKPEKSNGVIEKAVDALQAIPGIDDELLLDGCDILEDEKKAKTFLALDASYRKKWLLRKLGRS